MSDILFWNEARRELDEKKLLNKCNTFVDSLMANDYIYPHPYNETKLDDTTMDNVAGNSLSDFNRQLKKFTKLLNNRLSEAGVSAIDDNFTYHHKFVDMKGNNKGDVYLPFTLMLDDGQILLALAKIYEGKEAERKSGYQIVKWFLNEEDITKAVYGNKAREILSDKSYNELAKSISVIIKYNHKKFIKKNGSTLQKVLKDLKKENEELKARRDELLENFKSDKIIENGIDTGLTLQEVIPNYNKLDFYKVLKYFKQLPFKGRYTYDDFYNKFKGDFVEYNGDYYTFTEVNLLQLLDKYKPLIKKKLRKIEQSNNTEQLENSEELEDKYMISNMGGDYIVSDKTIMENGDYKRVASINKYNGEIEFEKDVNKNEIMEFIAPFIENKFPKDKELEVGLIKKDNNYYYNGVLLTADNVEEFINSFYQKLSGKELEDFMNNFPDIGELLNNRKYEVMEALELDEDDSYKFEKIEKLDNYGNPISYSLFNIKDNLEPIDEYIAKIKASPEYQEYIIENTPQEEEPANEPQDDEIETKLKALLESKDMNYINDELNDIVNNSTDEELEAVEELLNEVENHLADLD